ncbi:hypothetical protein IC229_18505 [Spirosoma sp. BT702]|uniref:Secretion system C-terminal sorting domain-containing protein n=1 Tax=Spirosoma profusum TaxID=2771354 RepID=A0A927AT55_9BACT|nr:hypothetical protein [Spirosoma profusum]MBD2702645.1 hypothetical protein [Spirosoma profusum]
MKTFAQSLIAALLLSTTTFAAPANPTVNPTATTSSYKAAVFPSATPSKLNVFVEREPGKALVVLLKSKSGDLLAKQSISKKQGNFHFKFDMAELEDGAYQVEIVSGNDVSVHPVTLSTKPTQISARTITLN